MIPRHVLVLSAPVGEGHVAAARALADRMRAHWPGTEVEERETVGGGAWRTRFLAWAYATTMRHAPRLYGVGYDLVARVPALAAVVKSLSARGTARRLAPVLAASHPDLVVSTYPLVTGGLARLRRRGRLGARAVAVVTDAAVHPFWAWSGVDETWVLTARSRAQAEHVAPGADVRVAPPAVATRFVPGDRDTARRTQGLPVEGFVVTVAGGSLGFGRLEAVVDAVLAADPALRVVALCGRHEALAARLARRGDARLVVHGWTDQVPGLLTAADLVVTTGGGVMATEALAVGRPVVFAAPVPGHGRAGAAVLAAEGLAARADRPADVAAVIAGLKPGSAELAGLAAAARRFGAADLDADLDALEARL